MKKTVKPEPKEKVYCEGCRYNKVCAKVANKSFDCSGYEPIVKPKVYCVKCENYADQRHNGFMVIAEACNAPKNQKDTYKSPGADRIDIPSRLNKDNNCEWYREKRSKAVLDAIDEINRELALPSPFPVEGISDLYLNNIHFKPVPKSPWWKFWAPDWSEAMGWR